MSAHARLTVRQCPFCGGEPLLLQNPMDIPGRIVSHVECAGCKASGPRVSVYFTEVARAPVNGMVGHAAIEAWNKRVEVSAPTAEPKDRARSIRADAGELIAFLDSLAKIDPSAVGALISARVPCNEALAAHPTVQVGTREGGGYEVGLLGVLNGYAGSFAEGRFRGWGPIIATMEEDGRCTAVGHTAEVMEARRHDRWLQLKDFAP